MAVAETILQQLGGNRFRAMTGAKDFVSLDGDTALKMRLPANITKNRISHVIISLTANDTYTISTYKNLKFDMVEIDRSECYVENLREVFTRLTGLDTHL